MRTHHPIAAVSILLWAAGLADAAPRLAAGGVTVTFENNRPSLTPAAAAVFVYADGEVATRRHDLDAAAVSETPDGVALVSTLRTPAGGAIEISDVWSARGDAFRLERRVTVKAVGRGETGFGTGVEIDAPADKIDAADVFVPAMWYGSPRQTPPSALTQDVGQRDYLFREDRMPLPLVSVREKATGRTLTLVHEKPDATTVMADANAGRTIDGRMKFASLGLRREPGKPVRLAFRMPGSEGEQTGLGGFKKGQLKTAERLHPMAVGATQAYTLTIKPGKADDLAGQLKDAWRLAYEVAAPTPVGSNVAKVYAASVGVLGHYAYDQGPVSGIPFAAKLPGGEVRDKSLQMGFVGQQLPCASYLIDDGLRTKNATRVAQGERIVDFWARECFSPAGVPRTWYDVDPHNKFRGYPSFVRVVTDGMSGALRAWQIERTAGRDKPEWLAFCRRAGDWLLGVQNPDGSFYRSFDHKTAKPAERSLTNTLHPVRFLVELSCATGDKKYQAAAARAAAWSLRNEQSGRYAGGTPDNPDVIDKEAGWIAFDSYLALYDVTADKRYLTAAADAAAFTETWMFAWDVPVPLDKADLQIPRIKTIAGAASIIATGHSGADLFLAFASLSYARLAVYTGDEHYADVARLLQANTAQLVDVNGSLGYAVPGLCVEAFSLVASRRGNSVGVWLPWGTSAILEPMARCREIFGTVGVNAAMTLPKADRDQRHAAWAKSRGYSK